MIENYCCFRFSCRNEKQIANVVPRNYSTCFQLSTEKRHPNVGTSREWTRRNHHQRKYYRYGANDNNEYHHHDDDISSLRGPSGLSKHSSGSQFDTGTASATTPVLRRRSREKMSDKIFLMAEESTHTVVFFLPSQRQYF